MRHLNPLQTCGIRSPRSLSFLPTLLITLLTLVAIAGCGDSENYVFTNTSGSVVTGNKLTVTPDVSPPVNARIIDTAVKFRISLFNGSGTLVEEQTVTRGQSAVFQNLADGPFLVRTVGLDSNNSVIGYFDRSINLTGDLALTVPALITTNTVPSSTVPVASQGSIAFLAFTQLPDVITGGQSFTLAVTAFDADGSVFTNANAALNLSVSGVQNQNLGAGNFVNGTANFPNNQFPFDTAGQAVFTAASGDLSASTPSIPVVAGQLLEPATELSEKYLTIFFSAVAAIPARLDLAIFPQYAHQWDLEEGYLSIGDGGNDSYDGANELSVSISGAGSFEDFYGSFSADDLTWLTPLFGQADGLVAATVVPPSSGFSVDSSTVAHLAPGKDNRLQQQLDLTNATSTTTLTWRDAYGVDDGSSEIPISSPLYRVVVRGSSDQILATLFSATDANGSTNRNADLSAFNGQVVTLSFEVMNAQSWYVFDGTFVDDVSVTDGNATQFVTNGDFETGDFTGWTTSLTPLSQHIKSPIQTLAGVQVQRFIYADPKTNWCRYTDQFTNTTGASITIDVRYDTNLGSDGDEVGYNAPNATGTAFASSDEDGEDDDLGYIYGTGATASPVDNGYTVDYTVTIPAGQTRSLVSFLIQDNKSSDGAEPTALLVQIANMSNSLLTSPQLLRGLSQLQFDSIANF